MSKPTSPTVEIKLDKIRHLKCDFNALVAIEEATGQDVLNEAVWQNPSATIMRALLWGCLLYEDTGLALEQVGAMLTFENTEYVSKKIVEVFEKSMPKGDKDHPLAKPSRSHG